MLVRILFCLILAATALPMHAVEDGSDVETPHRGYVTRFVDIFHGSSKDKNRDKDTVSTKNLTLEMELTPLPLKLSETRQLTVALKLKNNSRRLVQLHFPTTQRIEILIRDNAGRMVTQWSEDQSFANEESFVTINPGERIEYHASIATRDMTAGKEYVVEGFFPNFDQLKIRKRIQPEK